MTADSRPRGHDPLRSGLFPALIARSYQIDGDAWRSAADAGELVGLCRAAGCGGYLETVRVPPGDDGAALLWYAAACQTCGREVAAPGGRVLGRSGRHADSPSFWRRRADLLKHGQPGE